MGVVLVLNVFVVGWCFCFGDLVVFVWVFGCFGLFVFVVCGFLCVFGRFVLVFFCVFFVVLGVLWFGSGWCFDFCFWFFFVD